jgi:hypothetical protein
MFKSGFNYVLEQFKNPYIDKTIRYRYGIPYQLAAMILRRNVTLVMYQSCLNYSSKFNTHDFLLAGMGPFAVCVGNYINGKAKVHTAVAQQRHQVCMFHFLPTTQWISIKCCTGTFFYLPRRGSCVLPSCLHTSGLPYPGEIKRLGFGRPLA